MALTFTKVDAFVAGDRQVRVYDVLFDSSYPTNGEAVTPANFGLRSRITHVIAGPAIGTSNGAYTVAYDGVNKKLILNRQSTATGALAEVPNTTDVSAFTARVVVLGK